MKEKIVSTIIECPECATRYKMNKAVPEGGRFVKCARCGHQWRLVPGAADDGTANAALDERQRTMVDDNGGVMANAAHSQTSHSAASDDYSSTSWETRRESHASALSGMQHDDAAGFPAAASSPQVDSAAHNSAWPNYETNSSDPFSHDTSNGYSSASTQDEDTGDNAEWAERMHRPWRDDSQSFAQHEQQTGEDAEAAIRKALNAALDQPGTADHEEVEHAHPTAAEPFEDFWQGFSSEHDANSDDSIAYGNKDVKTVAAEIEQARRSSVIYDAATVRDGFSGGDDEPQEADEDIQNGLADAFRSEITRRPTTSEGLDTRYAHFADGTSDDLGPYQEGGEFIGNDAAALQAELEHFGQLPYEEPRRGGLATVAAWAVFMSVAAGVVLALVNFRADVVAAFPGTAGLYKLAGFSGPGQQIDFNNVAYRWTVADGKPVIEVTGQVVNRSDREARVPGVVVSMRDAPASQPVRTTANTQVSALGAGQSADFTIEFAASKDIRQIELEFDKIQ